MNDLVAAPNTASGKTLDHVLGYASAHELALDVQPAERDHVDEDEEEGAPHG